jgi:hypothetical protein
MRHVFLASFVLGVLSAVPCSARADLTYNIQNYPADQNGATLTGTITTDGTIGALGATDILSWTWTITPSGGTATTFSSTDANASMILVTPVASSSEITVAPDQILLLYNTALVDKEELAWDRGPAPQHYRGGIATGDVWADSSPAMGGVDPWVVAKTAATTAAPEPSTLIVAGAGGLIGIAYSLARKRKAARAA